MKKNLIIIKFYWYFYKNLNLFFARWKLLQIKSNKETKIIKLKKKLAKIKENKIKNIKTMKMKNLQNFKA